MIVMGKEQKNKMFKQSLRYESNYLSGLSSLRFSTLRSSTLCSGTGLGALVVNGGRFKIALYEMIRLI
jgi:hypothetical protein